MASKMPVMKKGRWATRRALLGATILASGYGVPALAADALPTGGQFVAGAGTIQANGVSATITQSSMAGIIEWQGFSIGAGNSVSIDNGAGATLNRVTGTDLSRLDGLLTATGSAFLINPNGIVVGPGGEVVTGGSFVASTRDIANEDFMDGGAMRFAGASEGDVVNAGRIVSQNGDVVLIGRAVTNTGSIEAAGEASLAAAGDVLLQTEGTGQRVFIQGAGPEGDVTNEGAVTAAEVQLAAANGNVYALAGNTDGVIRATGSTVRNGRVLLTASGTAEISGTLEAKNADGSGGTVDVDAGDIALSGHVDVSAEAEGKNGGEAVLIADRHMSFSGMAEAKGGKGAAGGFVETSGKQISIADTARVTTLAEDGETGTWLIDPNDLTVAASGGDITGATVSANLSGTNVTLDSDNGGSAGNGDIFINDDITWSANTTLTLDAVRNIEFNADVAASGNTAGVELIFGGEHIVNTGSLTLSGAGASLSLNGTAYTLIHDVTDLQNIQSNLSGNYALAVDIDASATSGWNAGAGYAPGGSVFSGTLDGFGHTISDLYINRPSTNYVGLFSYLAGTVRDTGIVGGSIEGLAYAGGIAGEIQGTGLIHRSYSTADITTNGAFAGGLAGTNHGAITESFASGNVLIATSNTSAGGLVGQNSTAGLIQDSYASGIVEGNLYVGGIAGTNLGTLNNVYATGHVTARVGAAEGGLTGSNSGTVTNGYYDGPTTGTNSGAGTYRTTSQLQSALPSGFSSTVWGSGDRLYPYFKWRWSSAPVAVQGTAMVNGLPQTGTVSILSNGALLDKLQITGADGRFYKLYDPSEIGSTGVIGFLDDVADTGAAYAGGLFGQSYLVYIENDRLYASAPQSSLSGLLAGFNTALGGYSDSDLDFISVAGNNLDVTGGLTLLPGVSGDFTLDGNITASTYLDLQAGGLVAGAAGDVTLQAGSFLFLNGTNGITIGNGGDVVFASTGGAANIFGEDITWLGDSNLTVRSGGDTTFVLYSGALGNGQGHFTLDMGGVADLSSPVTVDLGRFELQGGTWEQVGTLPSFAADDFRITGGTFIRAAGGDGTSGTPYQISDVYGIQGLASAGMLASHFVLANDIDASGTAGWNAGEGFNPIGRGTAFSGTLDGADHVISGLQINRPGLNGAGLFRNLSGSVSNIGLVGGAITGNGDTGSLAGFVDTGGLVHRSYATASVTGNNNFVGGLVGHNSGTITESFATGNVSSASSSAGGLVGVNDVGGIITDAYATGHVHAPSFAGGFAGGNRGTLTNVYARGRVTGNPGGLTLHNTGTITNGYYDQDTAGTTSGEGTGRSTSQMQSSLPSGFSSTVWGGGAGLYPYFKWRFASTPVAVKGTATIGGAALAGGSVSILNNGALLDQLSTGANGAFYQVYDASQIDPSGVIGFLDELPQDGASFSNVLSGTYYGLTVRDDTFSVRTNSGSLSSALGDMGTALGSYSDTDLDFITPTASNLDVTGALKFYTGPGNFILDGNMSATGDLTLYGPSLTAGSAGDVQIIAGGTLGVTGVNGVTIGTAGDVTLSGTSSASLQSSDIEWLNNSHRLTLHSGGNLIVMVGNIGNGIGDLVLDANGSIGLYTPPTVDLGRFELQGGIWSQVGTLPSFAADDFRITGGTFIRALGGNGLSATPYQIADIYGLQGIGSAGMLSMLTKHHVLANDIDASASASWNGGAGFNPIGRNTAFTGELDGAGHTISGLVIDGRGADKSALFGEIGTGGAVSNLILSGGSVTGDVYTASLVGVNRGTITNVVSSMDVTGHDVAIGGLAGWNDGTITASGATGTVTGLDNARGVGGLVGTNTRTITLSYATGDVSSQGTRVSPDGQNVGGLVGETIGGSIQQSFATGNVSTNGIIAGGFVGLNTGTPISNSYATGNVEGASYVGGFIGLTQGFAAIANTYATGTVSIIGADPTPYLGGFVGDFRNGTISNSFWNAQTSGLANAKGTGAGDVSGIAGLTTAQLQDLSTFTGAGWDIDDEGGTGAIWRIYDDYTAPLLRGFLDSFTVAANNVSKTYDGSAYSGGYTATYSGAPGAVQGTLGDNLSSVVNAGTYAIKGHYSGQFGYDITHTGTLTIDPASVTLNITPDAASKVYGQAISLTDFTATGLQFGDSVSSVTLTSAGTAAGANAGSYDIFASNAVFGSGSASNYSITYVPLVNGLTVTPATLSVTANALSKTYGATDPTLTYNHSGLVNGDTASIFTGALTRAGGETVAGGPYAISQGTLGAGGNYTINFTGADFSITPASLNVTANALSKIYGAADPALTFTHSGLVNGDDASVITGALTRAAGETVAGGLYAITQGTIGAGSNYTISFTGANFTITPKTLTVAVSANDKTYDGTVSATGTIGALTGIVGGDDVTAAGSGTFAFTNANVGSGKSVNVTGLALSGADASNYTLSPNSSSSASITPATLSVTAIDVSKTYGQADPMIPFSSSGFVGGDNPSLFTGALSRAAGETVAGGPYAIGQGTLSAGGNYIIDFTGANFTITPAALNVTANALSKIYGAADPSLTFTQTGLVNGDTASVFSGALARAAGETVAGGPYAIGQGTLSAGSNYTINFTGADFTVTPATLNVTANARSKVYGASDPTLTYGFSGFVSGDTSALFSGALARAAGETVAGGPYAIGQGTLSAGSNYAISFAGANFTITPKALTVNVSANDKVYDGTTAATGTVLGLNGIVGGDAVSAAGTGSFAFTNANAGTGKPVNVTGLSLSGADASNYTLSPTASSSASITPATLSVSANGATKVYGQADPAFTYGFSGFVGGDTSALFSGALSRAAGEDVAGSPYAINQGTLSAGGNYVIDFTGAGLTITPASLTVSADTLSKIYGQADPTLTFSVTGLTNGDDASIFTGALSRAAGETVAGGPYSIGQGTLSAGGNYTVSFTGADFTITPKALTITAADAEKQEGDTLLLSSYFVNGLVAGDSVSGVALSSPGTGEGATPGTYLIQASNATGSGLSNYLISYVDGQLTVTQMPALPPEANIVSVEPTTLNATWRPEDQPVGSGESSGGFWSLPLFVNTGGSNVPGPDALTTASIGTGSGDEEDDDWNFLNGAPGRLTTTTTISVQDLRPLPQNGLASTAVQ